MGCLSKQPLCEMDFFFGVFRFSIRAFRGGEAGPGPGTTKSAKQDTKINEIKLLRGRQPLSVLVQALWPLCLQLCAFVFRGRFF